MAAYSIGFHRNQGGDAGDIGPLTDYVTQLAAAGLRPFVVCIGEAGTAQEVIDAGGIAAFAKDDWRFAPAYDSGNAQADAANRWALIKSMWPPELSKEAWCIVLNEPDREHAPYVFDFMRHVAILANADGFKVCGPNYSAGNPEIDEWETPQGLAWLRYCAERPDSAAWAAHEYSLSASDIEAGSPWLVGRYQFVLDVCDEYGIAHPTMLVTECGYTYNDMPPTEQATAQLQFLADTYGDIPIALWTLGRYSQGSDLPPQMAQLVAPVTQWMLTNSEPDTEPPPTPTLAELIWNAGVASKKISHNPKASLGAAIRADEYWPLGDETGVQAGDVAYRVQLGKYPEGNVRRAYFVKVPKWGEVFYVEEGGDVQVWGAGGGPSVWLEVPYLSQWTPSANLSSGDCGPACVAMIANYFGRSVTVNQAAAACGQPPGSNSTSVTQLRNGLGYYGVTNVYQRPATLDYLRQQLDAGNPIIILLHYGSLTGNQDTFTGGHFFVAVGYGTDGDGDYFLVNDPNFWGSRITQGDHRRISAEELSLSMDEATRDGNYARQIIVATGRAVTPPPPPTPTIDLLGYLRGDGRLYEVRNAQGGQERCQSQASGNTFYQTKNSQWERLYYDASFIYRDVDTSPGGGRFYRLLEGGVPGSRWIPRHWREGERFSQARYVQFYRKSDCAPLAENSGNVTDTMRFVERYASFTFRTGITLQDVVKLEWVNGGELYYYARGFGLVGWERLHQDPNTPQWSAISEIHAPGSRPPNVREEINCL